MSECDLCQAPKANRQCGECGKNVCKNCVEFLEQDRLRFHPRPPAFTQRGVFCVNCFDSLVRPEIEHYDEVMTRSEAVTIVRVSYRGYIPCHAKAKLPTEVKDDAGRGIAIARLKFLCAWEGFDAVIELEAEHTKVRNHGWETKIWAARGQFVDLDHAKFRPPEESD